MTQPPKQVKEEKDPALDVSLLERSQLRRHLRQQRGAIEVATKQAWDEAIAARLRAVLLEKRPNHLAVYWPIQSEPALLPCFADLHQQGIALALPIVVAKGQALKFVAWTPGQSMENDAYGIPMPLERETEITPDCILAPCVGFNKANYRLGYGGGFYDRTLALHPEAYSIGIAYELNQSSFALDQYDIALDLILTEASAYSQQDHIESQTRPD